MRFFRNLRTCAERPVLKNKRELTGFYRIKRIDFLPDLMPGLKASNNIGLCGYTSDCATHEKGKNYHESTKVRKHEKNISNLKV
jgi:hypothetical protein